MIALRLKTEHRSSRKMIVCGKSVPSTNDPSGCVALIPSEISGLLVCMVVEKNLVRHQGLEPRTNGLRVRCSTIELMAHPGTVWRKVFRVHRRRHSSRPVSEVNGKVPQ